MPFVALPSGQAHRQELGSVVVQPRYVLGERGRIRPSYQVPILAVSNDLLPATCL